jgi:hypothetical protein
VDYEHYTAIAFADYGRVELFDQDVALPPLGEDWWREMVPGDPILVDDGVIVQEDCYSHMCDKHPRSAVGILEDGRTILLVAVDGRTDIADGMTREELAELMLELGAWRAMNLDGGGSTSLYLEGLGVLNDPSDGSERVVASSLGFTVVAGEPGCCIHETVEGASGIFGDIEDTSWVKPYAEALYQAGVTTGCDQDPLLFCPDCMLSRGELAVLVARAAGLDPVEAGVFEDVEDSDWRAPSINALYQAGITTGCGEGIFCPDRIANRWEVAAFVFRAAGFSEVEGVGLFDDLSESEAKVVEALAAACVTSGCDENSFCPDQDLSRGEAAAFLARGFDIGGLGGCEEPDSKPASDSAPQDSAAPGKGEAIPPEASCGCSGETSLLLLLPLLFLSGDRRQSSSDS